jgi:hypothetical protein
MPQYGGQRARQTFFLHCREDRHVISNHPSTCKSTEMSQVLFPIMHPPVGQGLVRVSVC